jgi:hypothetical protein
VDLYILHGNQAKKNSMSQQESEQGQKPGQEGKLDWVPILMDRLSAIFAGTAAGSVGLGLALTLADKLDWPSALWLILEFIGSMAGTVLLARKLRQIEKSDPNSPSNIREDIKQMMERLEVIEARIKQEEDGDAS